MKRTVTRTIKVVAVYTDDPENEEGQRWDDLRYLTPASILRSEKDQLLSTWFANTEYELRDDVIEVSAPTGDLAGGLGYGPDDPPEVDPEDAEAQRIAEVYADAADELAWAEAEEARGNG